MILARDGQQMEPFPKYQTPNFLEFYSRYKFLDSKSKHTADVAQSYYHFAYHQMISLSETCNSFFKIENPTQDEVMFYLRRSWSYAFGMYTLLRTGFEALSIMRKMIGKQVQIDDYYEKSVIKLIDIANDTVKHPTYKHGKVSEACEPQALSINCEIDIITWSDQGIASSSELDPMKDFMIMHDYMEHLARKLIEL